MRKKARDGALHKDQRRQWTAPVAPGTVRRVNGRGLRAVIGLCTLFSAACTVGPDFQRPAPPLATGYTPTLVVSPLGTSSATQGEAQSIVHAQQVEADWWQAISPEKLTPLINEALRRNPTLTAAEATLRQAQELYAARAGSTRYPQLEGKLSAQRQRFNPGALGQSGGVREFSLYNIGAGTRYNFDLVGGNRKALEALAARSEYQRFQLAGARSALVAHIVTTAITLASLEKQVEVTENLIASQENQLGLTEERIRLGHGEPDDALALQTLLEQTRAKLPQLTQLLQQNEHQLAILVGKAPGEGQLPRFSLQDFTLPPELPLLVPSELVRSRPDILGAEALLHAANAEYGVSVAKLYPQLDISADLGTQALTTGALFSAGSAVWSLVGQLTQPLFNPGLPAEKRAALAAFDAAAANYQSVVLEALRNVADTLRAVENDTTRLEALAAADSASARSLESTQNRYGLGATSYLDLLVAQQQRLQSELDLAEAQARRLSNTVAFYQSMGAGSTGANDAR